MSEDANALVDRIEEAEGDGDRVSIGDVADSLGPRAQAPFLILPMLIGLSPLGGVPSVPTTMTLIAALACVRILFGYEGVWLPGFLRRRSAPKRRVDQALKWMHPAARRLDRHFGHRLQRLTSPVSKRIAAAIVLLMFPTMPPAEVVPFAGVPLMLAICLFGVAFLTHDGVAMIMAFAVSAAAAGVFFFMVL